MKKKSLLFLIILILAFPVNIFAESNLEKEIKQIQAQKNLQVTGKIDTNLTNAVNNENIIAKDTVISPPSENGWIAVNKTKLTLTYYQGSRALYKLPVAIGVNSATPTVKVRTTHKTVFGYKNAAFTNPFGTRWIALSLKKRATYGIHGTNNPSSIGNRASHGCIRMFNENIEKYIFPAVEVGIPVWIAEDSELRNWGVYQDTVIEEEEEKILPLRKEEIEKVRNFIESDIKTEEVLDF